MADEPAKALEAATQLETVIVTARKREEELADVPASITVISGEQIRDQHLNTLGDLDRLAPKLQFSDANGVRTVYTNTSTAGNRFLEYGCLM